MEYSDIGVTLNTYTHLGLEDAEDELKNMTEVENARKELFCLLQWMDRRILFLLIKDSVCYTIT